ncbi:hypothetical protein UCREL1_6828 [Eutypa lata UCREL1]|uniref:Uncharacterized protein n=1 Tax=Eutypa lata (strain UCR-EL1) TaxID=1287681 RepID=M7SPP1_EUTLA|nr:hypothetical protein UCREL1_6828 [Eutypa lata UCREL1]
MNSFTQNIQTVTNHDIEAASAAKAPWETWIEEDILPEIDPVTNATTIKLLDVIRALLKAPDDDLEAASRAVAEYQSYFRSTYLDPESKDGWYLRNLPKNGSSLVDPLSSGTARQLWDQFKVNGSYGGQSEEEYKDWCNKWLSAAGFMARLLDLGVLGVPELTWVFCDLEDGLGQPSPARDGDRKELMGWQCQVAVAAQYILVAGHIIVEEIKCPTQRWVTPRTSDTWTAWAMALEKIACTSSEDGQWDLKAKARLAYDKMVELWLDVF